MKCSSRHTLAPIDSIFGGQLPPILPPGVRLVEAHSLQSERRPTSSSLPRNVYSGPEWRPTLFSPSTVYIPLGCRFYSLDTPGVHGAWILTEHFVTHFPIFSHIKFVVVFISREARGGWLIDSLALRVSLFAFSHSETLSTSLLTVSSRDSSVISKETEW